MLCRLSFTADSSIMNSRQREQGKAATDDNIRQAAKLAAEAAQPIADVRGSEDYKRSLVKTYTTRALRMAVQRAKGG